MIYICIFYSTAAQVKDLMSHWYRPDITREEACSLVKQMEACSFVVRDSQTVSGGYALTIKVSEELLRQRRKLADGNVLQIIHLT